MLKLPFGFYFASPFTFCCFATFFCLCVSKIFLLVLLAATSKCCCFCCCTSVYNNIYRMVSKTKLALSCFDATSSRFTQWLSSEIAGQQRLRALFRCARYSVNRVRCFGISSSQLFASTYFKDVEYKAPLSLKNTINTIAMTVELCICIKNINKMSKLQ